MKISKKTMKIVAGVAAIGGLIYYFGKGKSAPKKLPLGVKQSPTSGMPGAPVRQGEDVSATSFKTVQGKPTAQPNKMYVPAQLQGNQIVFHVPATGTFTRLVYQSGNTYYAELAL